VRALCTCAVQHLSAAARCSRSVLRAPDPRLARLQAVCHAPLAKRASLAPRRAQHARRATRSTTSHACHVAKARRRTRTSQAAWCVMCRGFVMSWLLRATAVLGADLIRVAVCLSSQACAAGFVNDGKKDACTQCKAGKYADAAQSKCLSCASGSVSSDGASVCTSCTCRYCRGCSVSWQLLCMQPQSLCFNCSCVRCCCHGCLTDDDAMCV
jgi:hypothetical protein